MHLKWPSGHSRLKQGLHGRSSFRMRASRRERRRVGRAARAVQRDERLAERGGHVHEPGIVADHEPRGGEHVDRLGERGAPAQVAAPRPARGARSRRRSPRRSPEPTSHTAKPCAASRCASVREIARRPALGRPVFRARAQRRGRAARRRGRAARASRAAAPRPRAARARAAGPAAFRRAPERERGVALRDLRQALLVQRGARRSAGPSAARRGSRC